MAPATTGWSDRTWTAYAPAGRALRSTSRTAPPGTRTTPSPGSSACGPVAVSTRTCTTDSSLPGTPIRTRLGPPTKAAGMTCSVAGSSVGVASSAPRPTAPSIQLSSRTAVTTPPVAATCTTGVVSGPTIASSRRVTRPCGGTATFLPLADAMGPPAPRTVTSAETEFAPGLVTTRRSRRVLSPPPATSHRSALAAVHGVVTSARFSPWVWSQVCRAPVPGASEPVAVTCPTLAPWRVPETTTARWSD